MTVEIASGYLAQALYASLIANLTRSIRAVEKASLPGRRAALSSRRESHRAGANGVMRRCPVQRPLSERVVSVMGILLRLARLGSENQQRREARRIHGLDVAEAGIP